MSLAALRASIGLFLLAPPVLAQPAPPPQATTEEAKLIPDDSGDLDTFGRSVDVDGDLAVVGSRRNVDDRGTSGAAYVFRRAGSTWRKEAKLLPSEPVDFGWFGHSVAIDGDRIVVGQPIDYPTSPERQGAAFVYVRDGTRWVEEDKVVSGATGLQIDKFGWSVDISGDTIAVGSTWDDDGATHCGATFVFTRSGSNWSQQAKLIPFDPDSNDEFGTSVSIEGNRLAVGSPGDNTASGVNSGSVYVYTRAGSIWSLEDKLVSSIAEHNVFLGTSVAYSADSLGGYRFIVAGAPLRDSGGTDRGGATRFYNNGSGWTLSSEFTAFDAADGDEFGTSVALDGGRMLVGSPRDDTPESAAGAAYAFEHAGVSFWIGDGKLLASDGASVDSHGFSVAVSGTTALVGSPQDDGTGPANGAAYFYEDLSPWTEIVKVNAEELLPGDAFGFSSAADFVVSAFFGFEGEKVVVGAPGDEMVADDGGAAYVFRRVGTAWDMEDHLRAEDVADGARLGHSVDISDDTVVAGAPGDGFLVADSGAVWVFEHEGFRWDSGTAVFTLDGAAGDQFGHSVSIDEDTMVVGAWGDDDAGANSGSAYVFVRSGTSWVQEAKLAPSDPRPGHLFGYSVAVSGERVAVGAIRDDDGGASAGAAYVFARSGTSWSQEAKVVAGDPDPSDDFGVSIALWQGTLVVGSYREDEGGTQAGAAYVYQRSGSSWSQTAKLIASDAEDFDLFGYSVAVDGPRIVVGARDDAVAGPGSGSAYVFVPSGVTWIEDGQLVTSDHAAFDDLGWSVGVAGNVVVAGAQGKDDEGMDSGAAYTFALDGGPGWSYCFGDGSGVLCPCINFGFPGEGCANSTGSGAIITATGSASVSEDDLILTASQMPTNQFGIFYMGPGAFEFPFGDGIRCVTAAGVGIFRFPLQNSGATGSFAQGPGVVAYTQASFPPPARITAGQRWNFQAWFRDPMGPCGTAFNYSSGMTVVFTP